MEEFVETLRPHGVTMLADVRTVPRSRHNPQFNRETLPNTLAAAGLKYEHIAALGGLRKTSAGSPNTGYRNASFRGFADYTGTPEFESGLARLMELASSELVVVMCAEAVPWRCHRSLIADVLVARGIDVEHILGEGRSRKHVLTPWARVEGEKVRYPG